MLSVSPHLLSIEFQAENRFGLSYRPQIGTNLLLWLDSVSVVFKLSIHEYWFSKMTEPILSLAVAFPFKGHRDGKCPVYDSPQNQFKTLEAS